MPEKKGDGLRKFGLDVIGDAPWGTHLCQFYQTKQDLIDILVPYFKAGLENNEFCMWITAKPLESEDARLAMEKAMPDFSGYVKCGQIEIISYKDWYLKGGSFDCDRVLDGWVSKLENALKNGFDGLRLTGNTFWLEKSDWRAFTDYEEAVNNVIGKHPMIAVCTYSLEKCNANEIMDVIRNHQFALVKREGIWELIESSERKRIAEDLRKTEQKFQALYNSMTEGVALHEIIYDDSGKTVDYVITDVNPSFERITGLSKEQAVGKRASELYGTGTPPYLDVYAKVASSGKPASFETYFPPMKKHFNISVFSPSKGKFNTIFYDITERKKAEEGLSQAKRDWELTFDSVPDLIAILDKHHKIVRANRAMAQRLGTTPERCIGLHCYQCVHGTNTPPEFCPHAETLKDEQEHIAEVKEPRLGGCFLVSTTPLRDERGQITGSIHVARDITRRKKNEEIIRESESRLNRSQEIAHLGSWELDLLANKLTWSDEVYRIFGLKPQEFVATYEAFLDAVHPDDRAAVDAAYSGSLQQGKDTYEIEHRVVRKSTGEVRVVHEKCNHIRNESGRIIRSVGMVHDITEQKEMQQKLEEYANKMEQLARERAEKLKDAERLAAIGATAGMVGHDIRNPLQAIIGDLYLAKDDLNSLPESEAKTNLKDSIFTIEEQLGYINKIVTDLQDYAKPLKPCNEDVDLENIVKSTFSIVTIPENIQVTSPIEKGLRFTADSAFIKRVMQNLISNAVQAMPKGGKLTVQTYHDNDSAIITVEDTGIGIPEQTKTKLFQPLFTTKSKGQGFGLAVCKRLVEAMNGTITFDSTEGKGTRFTVRLPIKESKK